MKIAILIKLTEITETLYMLSHIKRTILELILVSKILPLRQYLRWISGIPFNLPNLLRTKSLGVLDDCFGNSFDVLWEGKKLHFDGMGFGVIREIYGHLCYVDKGQLKNAQNILDLGGNGGSFTLFALVEAPFAKVHTVEALSEFIEILEHNIEQNGYSERVSTERAVVGGFYDDWTNRLLEKDPNYPVFDIHRYMSEIDTLDFLKCDVEGGEFNLMKGDLSWTKKVKNMSLEYHPTKGDVQELETILKSLGFSVRRADHSCLGYFYCTRS